MKEDKFSTPLLNSEQALYKKSKEFREVKNRVFYRNPPCIKYKSEFYLLFSNNY